MPDEVIAAPSTATAEPTSETPVNHQEVLNSLTSEQRTEWRMSGKLPETPAKEDSTPSKSDADLSAKSAPASEAGHQEKPAKRDNAETRLKELLADLKTAGFTPAELKTFKRETAAAQPKAESTPAPKIELKAEPQGLEAPKEPEISAKEYQGEDGWQKYEADIKKYNRAFAEYASKKAVMEFQEGQRRDQELQRVQSQIKQGREKYQDFDEKALPVIEALGADPKSPVYEMVGRSPVFQHLVYVIGGEKDEFLALAKADPWAAVTKAAVMQALILEELKGAKGDEKPRNADGAFVKSETPVKKVTGAPPPVSEVGGTAAAPGDKVGEAVQKRDFASYRAEMNRKEMAARKGS